MDRLVVDIDCVLAQKQSANNEWLSHLDTDEHSNYDLMKFQRIQSGH